ncbi:MAG: hypothetical protein D6713_05775 [Deltaproteobacteria bacterium]|nr:MAG: hypothetical protein D6713_05775 [Deltaproteobacteria bacterium]
MNGRKGSFIPLILAILFFFSLVETARAQPMRKRVLGSVESEMAGTKVLIRVYFNFPVRYISHFPDKEGKELRIKIDPLFVSPEDRPFIRGRESAPIPDTPEWGEIVEITYEGDMEGGPFLTFLFNNEIGFSVSQGEDFRSLVVTVKKRNSSQEDGGGEAEGY